MLLRRRILVRLLLLDQPVALRTEAEIESEARKNYPWNFRVSLLDGVSFWFGLAFVSSATIVPLFVSKVTLNPLLIGLIAMIAQAGWQLPQLLSAHVIERSARKKPILVNLGFFLERVPVLLWPLGALVSVWSPPWGLAVFIVGWSWHGFGAGLVAPAWQDLLARIIPIERRGKMYGITTFLGTGFAAGGAVLSGYILEKYEYPYDFVIIFSIAAVALFTSWLFLALTREPLGAPVAVATVGETLWSRMMDILRIDVNFRRFLIVRALYTLGTMGLGFVTVSAVEQLSIADAVVGYYTVTLLVGQTVGGLISGIIADRRGHKVALALGALTMALAFGVIVFA
ncbi:MAG: MFS transporter, partial [Litorilinea sp.]